MNAGESHCWRAYRDDGTRQELEARDAMCERKTARLTAHGSLKRHLMEA